jgi:hypothetical protein
VSEAEVKKLSTSSGYEIEFVRQRFERAVGENRGWSSYLEKQVGIQKRENDQLRSYI